MNTKRTVEEVRNKTVFSAMKGCNVGLWFSGPTCSGNTLSGNVVEFSVRFIKPYETLRNCINILPQLYCEISKW